MSTQLIFGLLLRLLLLWCVRLLEVRHLATAMHELTMFGPLEQIFGCLTILLRYRLALERWLVHEVIELLRVLKRLLLLRAYFASLGHQHLVIIERRSIIRSKRSVQIVAFWFLLLRNRVLWDLFDFHVLLHYLISLILLVPKKPIEERYLPILRHWVVPCNLAVIWMLLNYWIFRWLFSIVATVAPHEVGGGLSLRVLPNLGPLVISKYRIRDSMAKLLILDFKGSFWTRGGLMVLVVLLQLWSVRDFLFTQVNPL